MGDRRVEHLSCTFCGFDGASVHAHELYGRQLVCGRASCLYRAWLWRIAERIVDEHGETLRRLAES